MRNGELSDFDDPINGLANPLDIIARLLADLESSLADLEALLVDLDTLVDLILKRRQLAQDADRAGDLERLRSERR